MEGEFEQSGNQLVARAGPGFEIHFDRLGRGTPEPADDCWLLWLLLPVAMATSDRLHIVGRGTREAARNAEALSQIWGAWRPTHFRPVRVSFESYAGPVARAGSRLMLYSGGVDSVYHLRRLRESGDRPALLTLHGLDYRHDDTARFRKLLAKLDPLAERCGNGDWHSLRTDAYSAYGKLRLSPEWTHGFVLASALFLFSGRYSGAEIAADSTVAEEYLYTTWGTSTLTNRFFSDGSFGLATGSSDVSRLDKVASLAGDDHALKTLTFCKDYAHRPGNCGVCRKCALTKMMFVAATGKIPDIFAQRELLPAAWEAMELHKPYYVAQLAKVVRTAAANGTLDQIPGLRRHAEKAGIRF